MLTLALAQLSYVCIEQPFRKFRYRNKFRLLIVAAMSLVAASGSLIFFQKCSNILFTDENLRYGINLAPKGGQGILSKDPIIKDSYPVAILTGDSFQGIITLL